MACAICLRDQTTLYGRYWGCSVDKRFLHFELCYYQAIDFAIAQGLRRVEAGAQGEHKLARGYLADLIVPLPVEDFGMLDFGSHEAIIERGYQATWQALERWMPAIRRDH